MAFLTILARAPFRRTYLLAATAAICLAWSDLAVLMVSSAGEAPAKWLLPILVVAAFSVPVLIYVVIPLVVLLALVGAAYILKRAGRTVLPQALAPFIAIAAVASGYVAFYRHCDAPVPTDKAIEIPVTSGSVKTHGKSWFPVLTATAFRYRRSDSTLDPDSLEIVLSERSFSAICHHSPCPEHSDGPECHYSYYGCNVGAGWGPHLAFRFSNEHLEVGSYRGWDNSRPFGFEGRNNLFLEGMHPGGKPILASQFPYTLDITSLGERVPDPAKGTAPASVTGRFRVKLAHGEELNGAFNAAVCAIPLESTCDQSPD